MMKVVVKVKVKVKDERAFRQRRRISPVLRGPVLL